MKSSQTFSLPSLLLRVLMLAFFCAGLAAPGQAFASENILDKVDRFMTAGPLAKLKAQALKNYGFALNPYFKTGFELTDNVFKIPEPNRQDVLWTFTPGFNATHTSKYGQVGLSYESQFRYFTRHELQNEQDQSFSAFVNLYPTDKLNLKVSEEFVQQGSTAGAPSVEPLNSTDNTVRASAIYELSETLSTELGYKNFSRYYAGEIFETFSYLENEYFLEGQYKLNENHTAITGYHFGTIDYTETSSRNATYHQLPIGLRGDIIYGIQYDATVAAYIRNQEASARNNFWAFIGSLDLKKNITEKTTVGGGFMRRPVESTYDNAELSDNKTFYGNITHRFTPRLRGRFDLSWTNADFESSATTGGVTVKRDDDIFGVGIGVDFALRKWMILNADYRVERRNSNLSAFDYTENRFVIGTTIPL